MYVKASATAGTEAVGDCPFCQKVLLALHHCGVEYDLVTVDLSNKPESFLAINPSGSVPVSVDPATGKTINTIFILLLSEMICCMFILLLRVDVHPEKVCAESDDIVKQYCPALPCELPEDMQQAVSLFPTFVPYLKNADAAREEDLRLALLLKLAAVSEQLTASGGPFLAGAGLSFADFKLFPQLHHVKVAALHYKGFDLAAENPALQRYHEAVSSTDAARAAQYSDADVIAGWKRHIS